MNTKTTIRIALFSAFISAGLVLFAGTNGSAGVSGACYNCHTMHNSQKGLTMILDSTPSVGGSSECLGCHAIPREEALRIDCIGCHAADAGAGPSIVGGITPQIAHNGTDLAAGNYRYVMADDAVGHNVHGFDSGFIGIDGNIGDTPPGYLSAYDPAATDYNPALPGTPPAPRLLCAGQNGCHGDRDIESQTAAMFNTHHADDSALRNGSLVEGSQGGTVGTSYRFLKGIKGGEDIDWEATTGANDHNMYKGITYAVRSTQTWGGGTAVSSISQLCAECHGDFHATGSDGIGTDASWLRHPTDIILPNTGEYASFTTYSTDTPIGRTSISGAVSGTVTPGADIVICLSCHRAHASQYNDALRFSYGEMVLDTAGGGQGKGCFVCHGTKDG